MGDTEVTREESHKRLAELAKKESNNYEFLEFISSGEIQISKKNSNNVWTAGSRLKRDIIASINSEITAYNEERSRIRTSLAMGITDDEVGDGKA